MPIRLVPLRAALLLALAGSAGCGASDAPEVQIPRDLKRTADAVAREAAAQREGAEKALEEKLLELERRLARARAFVGNARATHREAERHLAELERQGRELRLRLEQARRSGARARREVESAIDRALEDLETTWGLSEEGAARP